MRSSRNLRLRALATLLFAGTMLSPPLRAEDAPRTPGPFGPAQRPWEKTIPEPTTVTECNDMAYLVGGEFVEAAADHNERNMAFDLMEEAKRRCKAGQLQAAHRLIVEAQQIAKEMGPAKWGSARDAVKKRECFFTTAACELVGLPDDCFELATLRRYRDEVLAEMPGGRRDIALYYALAPSILASIRRQGRERDLLRVYFTHILPCTALARLGLNAWARRLYAHMLQRLCFSAATRKSHG